MRWVKCSELEYNSEDDNASVYYSEAKNWVLDIDGEQEVIGYVSCASAQHGYENYLRDGGRNG